MCDHTREPTVLSRVSCRPSHLNFNRFHQPCLLPGRTSRIGGSCRFPRTTWRPLTLAGSTVLPPCVSLEVFATPTRRYHGRMLVHPSPTSSLGVCTHAGPGPLRARRRLLVACLGDRIPLATHIQYGKYDGRSCSE